MRILHLVPPGKKRPAGDWEIGRLQAFLKENGNEVLTTHSFKSWSSPKWCFLEKVSRKKYKAEGGLPLNFNLMAAVENFCRFPWHIHPDVLFEDSSQCDYLRAYGLYLKQIFESFKPELLIVKFFAYYRSIIATEYARFYDVPIVYHEVPLVPNASFLIDRKQALVISENNWLSEQFKSKPQLSETDRQNAKAFLKSWLSNKSSKYTQQHGEKEQAAIGTFLKKNRGPTLLFALQVPRDSSILYNLPHVFNSYMDWVRTMLEALSPHYNILMKRHPRSLVAFKEILPSNVLYLTHAHIHELFKVCDGVVTLSSNVGLEGALAGKPVLVGGRPSYYQKGITVDLQWDAKNYKAQIPQKLQELQSFRPPTEKLYTYICKGILDYHIWRDKKGESQRVQHILEKAKSSLPIYPDFQNPASNLLHPWLYQQAKIAPALAKLHITHYKDIHKHKQAWKKQSLLRSINKLKRAGKKALKMLSKKTLSKSMAIDSPKAKI